MESYRINIGKIPDGVNKNNETHVVLQDSFGNAYIQLEYNIDIIESVSINGVDLTGFISYKGHSNQPSTREFTIFFSDEYSDVVYVNKTFIGKNAVIVYSGSEVSSFVKFNYMRTTHGPGSIVIMSRMITDQYTLRFIKRMNGQSFNSFSLYTELNNIKDSGNKSIVSSGSMLNTCGQFPKSTDYIDFTNFTKDGKIWSPRIRTSFNWDQRIGDTHIPGTNIVFQGGGGCWTGTSRESFVRSSAMRINNIRYSINSGTFSLTSCLIEPKNIQTMLYMITL